MATAPNVSHPDRQDFYRRIAPHGMAPLWESLHALVPRQPTTPVRVHKWDYDREVRPYLMEAGALITAREAERRVLMLQNPGLDGRAAITQSLYAGLQLILPGEVAPAHRHTQSALRFIIEGEKAYTAVAGEKTLMNPGDLVITPSWTWHDHGNDSDKPMVWLDALDIPLVAFLDTGFAEPAAAERQDVSIPLGDSTARYANNLLPVDWKPNTLNSPIFNYPYERTRQSLATLAQNGGADAHHGFKMRYVNPATGSHVTPTIAAFIQLLPAGFQGQPYRSTDGTVYSVVEGEGETRIGDEVVRWRPRDVFVVPSWAEHTHHASGEAVLFSFSDRCVQEKLGLWREQRSAT
jgi:gentisate 1,2-dioxygenase